jgi:hypothetical protein
MNRPLLFLSLIALTAGGLVLASRTSGAQTASASRIAPSVERGRYLATVMLCNDCHTPFKLDDKAGPPERDWERRLSGHPESLAMPPAPAPEGPWIVAGSASLTAWSGPWGTSFTANLTPDPETGLGRWTFEDFAGALRTGRHMGKGRPILPPMPWEFIGQLEDSDLESLFLYLNSQPPVRNKVPEPIPPAAR